MTHRAILAIDEGTTNAKAILVREDGAILAGGACAVETRYPRPGWVEQGADRIWSSTLTAITTCLENAPEVEIVAIGISNQRESILAWNRHTGEPLGPVVTWQCRRTSAACDALRAAGHEDVVIAKTGLPLDPLFPATKVGWLLENHCRGMASECICIGTVDAWLIWNFTGGRTHATDASNAARTLLYDIGVGEWDEQLCRLFGVDRALLPDVHDSSHVFGETRGVDGLPDGIPVASAIGDSHGALFGHGAFGTGDSKVTFGTGSSVMTTIREFTAPPRGITTTIAWSFGGRPTYAFEGNILVSASILPWTAELLGLSGVDALMDLAQTVDDSLGVTLVPAHVGLGAPHWNADARGVISGLTFGAGPAHIARAAAESMALQVCDVVEIIEAHSSAEIGSVHADGGPSRNAYLMQMVADYLDHPVIASDSPEASARGAAFLAGLAVGFWSDLDTIAGLESHGTTLRPGFDAGTRTAIRAGWRQAVARAAIVG
ncbi:MAG: FGGY-family carbohydrate kinase [Thiotrichales bacterium]|nr:FGGY-family carbohydrate kinase [Thiotrichales bacterium]